MARNSNPPRSTTSVNPASQRQLAALATLLGLMQTASKLSQVLDTLASEVGGSVEEIAEQAGVPFFDVHQTYVEQQQGARKLKKPRRLPLGAKRTILPSTRR